MTKMIITNLTNPELREIELDLLEGMSAFWCMLRVIHRIHLVYDKAGKVTSESDPTGEYDSIVYLDKLPIMGIDMEEDVELPEGDFQPQ